MNQLARAKIQDFDDKSYLLRPRIGAGPWRSMVRVVEIALLGKPLALE